LSEPPARVSDKLGRPRLFDDDTERRIVMDAAVRAMARNGYTAMSVSDILAKAELSTTSLYRHFQSKDALLSALIRRDGQSARRALERTIEAASGAVAALQAWLDGLLDQLFEPRKATRRALFSGSEVVSSYWMIDELMKMRWMLSEPLVDVLRAGHDAGTLHSPNPEADAIRLFAVVTTAATSPHAYRGGREGARAQAVRFAWAALRIADKPAGGYANRVRSMHPDTGPPPLDTTATSGVPATWRAPASPRSCTTAS
jgi:AcrR family transcriptional regulator